MAKKKATKKNLKKARSDADILLGFLMGDDALFRGSGPRVEDIVALSEVGDTAPMTKKGKLSKLVRKANLPKDQPLSAMQQIANIIGGKGGYKKTVPASLEAAAIAELPEDILGQFTSDVVIPQQEAELNERKIKRLIMEAAPSKASRGTKGATRRSETALRNKDLIALEQDAIDEWVKAGLDEDAATRRVESMREEFFEAERKGRPRDPSRTLKSVAQGTDSTRKWADANTPIRERDLVIRERDRVGPAMSEDMMGRQETPSLGGTKTDELGVRQNIAVRNRKGSTFSIADQANYSEFVFEPGTGKAAGAFSIKRVNAKTGRPLRFTAASKKALASVLGGAKLAKMISGDGTKVQYVSAESLFKAARNNPKLGALIDNPAFMSAFSRTKQQGEQGVKRLQDRYRARTKDPITRDKVALAKSTGSMQPERFLRSTSQVKKAQQAEKDLIKRYAAEKARLKGGPVVSKEMTPKQRKKIEEKAQRYAKQMEALKGEGKPRVKVPPKVGSPLITKGMSTNIRTLPLLAIAAALKGMK